MAFSLCVRCLFTSSTSYVFQIAGGLSWANPMSLWAIQGGAAQNPWDCLKVWTKSRVQEDPGGWIKICPGKISSSTSSGCQTLHCLLPSFSPPWSSPWRSVTFNISRPSLHPGGLLTLNILQLAHLFFHLGGADKHGQCQPWATL